MRIVCRNVISALGGATCADAALRGGLLHDIITGI